MRARWLLLAVAVICWAMTAQAQNKFDNELAADGVAAKIKEIVERNFYKPADFPSFVGKHPTNADIDKALADLKASHTRRFMPGTLEYYDVADIYGSRLGTNRRFAFPPYGEVKYDGIGIATSMIDGKRFVTDVYDASFAKTAGILVGDEILAVDDLPFDEIKSFEGRAGKVVKLKVRRSVKAQPMDVPVMVTSISPARAFLEATNASARIIENGRDGIGYVRLWALASPLTSETVNSLIRDGLLSKTEGLIVDLRGRWGGLSSELPEVLVEDIPDISFSRSDGESLHQREAWRKPIIVLVDDGTRSANELLACAIKKRGFTLIGEKSAGAVLGADAYVLPDKSLLVLATWLVQIDGEILEGKGVMPDLVVDAPLPYAMGADPQLDAAVDEMKKQIAGVGFQRGSKSPGQARCSEGNNARSN